MRKQIQLLVVFVSLFLTPLTAAARVHITINLSTQRMAVQASNGASYSWRISTARAGYVTPRGVYSAVNLQRMHYSKKYHHSPMPHSIFFRGGFAIHGTYETRWLGHPASHGCVRLSPAHAATLFKLVRAEGATIHIIGSPPPSRPFARAGRRHAYRHHFHHSSRYSRSGQRGHGFSYLSNPPRHRHSHSRPRIFGFATAH